MLTVTRAPVGRRTSRPHLDLVVINSVVPPKPIKKLRRAMHPVDNTIDAPVAEHEAAPQEERSRCIDNASTWLGGALGIAIFSAIATSRTNRRLAPGASRASALASGFRAALLAAAVFLAVAALIALRSRNAAAAEMMDTDPGRACRSADRRSLIGIALKGSLPSTVRRSSTAAAVRPKQIPTAFALCFWVSRATR